MVGLRGVLGIFLARWPRAVARINYVESYGVNWPHVANC